MSDNTGQRQGQCDQCGRTNSRNDLICYSCGALLPWATLPKAARKAAAPVAPASKVSATPQGFAPPRSASASVSGGPGRQAGQPTAQEMAAFHSAPRSDGGMSMTRRHFFGNIAGWGLGGLGGGALLLRVLLRGQRTQQSGRAKEVNELFPNVHDDRQALQQLSGLLDENPSTPRFRIRWMLKPAGGSVSYPELRYERRQGTLTYDTDGAGATTFYQVSDAAIKAVAQSGGAVSELMQHGATTTNPLPQATLPSATVPPTP